MFASAFGQPAEVLQLRNVPVPSLVSGKGKLLIRTAACSLSAGGETG